MDFSALAKARFSVRSFSEKPLKEEELNAVLEAGRCAPTACNYQPQKIYVLKSEKAIAAIRAITRCAFNAPVVLLVCGDTAVSWKNPFSKHDSMDADCSIVATQMMLKAAELGLGTTWVGYFDPEKVREAFSLPEGVEPLCLLPIGYPASDAVPSEMHGSRKPLSETVTVF